MTVAIAVTAHQTVANHFGKAAAFLIVDPQGTPLARVENADGRQPGCRHKKQLQQALLAYGVTTLILGNIGQRSLGRLLRAGLAVYRVPARTLVSAALAAETPKEALTDPAQGRACSREKGSCGCGCGKPKPPTAAKIGVRGANATAGLIRLGGWK
ncbi:NifB/NifX family molybdenum-iron cluster-binding protein [Photobacterium sp. TY1-4]|uniref:NifB/NifX family molybdenum-iron cluster-binding protein n=1 Tax=Photobacterium sp. TY1-4 TaxID=2899122 RepID=UPI0021C1AFFE|nr:NifB/NifX family molybdenum-iron cluster-binding protein [Photobacterium sp. TY1-4]UXI01733.1 hypothetical protein NH461_02495 [Photobacterium sp. TY1-4]